MAFAAMAVLAIVMIAAYPLPALVTIFFAGAMPFIYSATFGASKNVGLKVLGVAIYIAGLCLSGYLVWTQMADASLLLPAFIFAAIALALVAGYEGFSAV